MVKRLGFLLTAIIIVNLLIGCGERMTKEQLFALAAKYKKEESFFDAIKTYERLVKKYPDANQADQAQYKIALIYSNNLSNFDKSIESHKKLIDKYPDSKYVPYAEKWLAQCADQELEEMNHEE